MIMLDDNDIIPNQCQIRNCRVAGKPCNVYAKSLNEFIDIILCDHHAHYSDALSNIIPNECQVSECRMIGEPSLTFVKDLGFGYTVNIILCNAHAHIHSTIIRGDYTKNFGVKYEILRK